MSVARYARPANVGPGPSREKGFTERVKSGDGKKVWGNRAVLVWLARNRRECYRMKITGPPGNDDAPEGLVACALPDVLVSESPGVM